MESEREGWLRRQTGNYAFLENLGRGGLSHAFMALDNQGDADVDALLRSTRHKGPAEALSDLQLPEALFSKFLSLLTDAGHQYKPETEKSLFGPHTYTSVQLRSNGGNRILIYIPDWIIADPNPENLSAIIALGNAFKQASFLIIFHNERPDPQIRLLITRYWSRYEGCKLWSKQDLNDINSRSEVRELLINDILDI